VTVGCVVGDDVEEDAEPESARVGHEGLHVGDVAVVGVDRPVVDDVVTAVRAAGGVVRVDPQRIDPEPGEVRQAGTDACQIADAVAVAVGEGAQVDLVDHCGPPPGRRGFGCHPLLGGVGPRSGKPSSHVPTISG
jgi:hypothetical protein